MPGRSSGGHTPGPVATTRPGSEGRRTRQPRSRIGPHMTSTPQPQVRMRPTRDCLSWPRSGRRARAPIARWIRSRCDHSRFPCPRHPVGCPRVHARTERASRAGPCRGPASFWIGRLRSPRSPSRATCGRGDQGPADRHSLSRSESGSSGWSASSAGAAKAFASPPVPSESKMRAMVLYASAPCEPGAC